MPIHSLAHLWHLLKMSVDTGPLTVITVAY